MATRIAPPQTALRAEPTDWRQWADGNWWELSAGRDFDQTPRQAAKAFRMWCRRNGFGFHAKVLASHIEVVAWPVERDEPAAPAPSDNAPIPVDDAGQLRPCVDDDGNQYPEHDWDKVTITCHRCGVQVVG